MLEVETTTTTYYSYDGLCPVLIRSRGGRPPDLGHDGRRHLHLPLYHPGTGQRPQRPPAAPRSVPSAARETINTVPQNYTLDIAAGLTQVLSDEADAYLYGVGRIGQGGTSNWQYHLGDALGSLRQLADGRADGTLATRYEPYGEPSASSGMAASAYSFIGEPYIMAGLLHLRARHYSPTMSRFLSKDSWEGDPQRPSSLNSWLYAHDNPVGLTDHSGRCVDEEGDGECDRSGLPEPSALDLYGITLSSDPPLTWRSSDIDAIEAGVVQVAYALSRSLAEFYEWRSPHAIWADVFGTVTFHLRNQAETYCCERYAMEGVLCYRNALGRIDAQLVRHELGHVFNAEVANRREKGLVPGGTRTPYETLRSEGIYALSYVNGEFSCNRFVYINSEGELEGTGLGYRRGTQDNLSMTPGEDFANMFANWSMNSFVDDEFGIARWNWMQFHMYYWLDRLLEIPGEPPTMPLDY